MQPQPVPPDAGAIDQRIVDPHHQHPREWAAEQGEPQIERLARPLELFLLSFLASDTVGHMNLTDTNTTSHSATHDQTTKYQYAAITVVSVKCFFSTGPSSITSAMSSVSRLPAIRCAR